MDGKQILSTLDHRPEVTDYPGVDGVILKDLYTIRLDRDGRVSQYRYQFKRIFRDFERDRRSDIQVIFNQKRQQVKILKARSIMRDDKIMDTPEYGINQITPPYLQKAPYFTDLQARVVSLVGIEVGGYTEIEYEIDDVQSWRSAIYGTIPLRLHLPIMSRQIVIEFPTERPLTCGIEAWPGSAVTPEKVTEKGLTRLTYTFKDLPHWDDQDSHNLSGADCPKLMYAEHPTWSDLKNALHQRVTGATCRDDKLENRTKELLKEIACPYLRCLRLNKHVTEALATVDFDQLFTCHTVRPVNEVLQSGYGTALEKAVVLAEMLRSAGHQAHVALACPQPALPREIFHLGAFPEVWVQVHSPELFMRPDKSIDEARREHLEGRTLVSAGPDYSGPERIELSDAGEKPGNFCEIKINLTMKKDAALEGTAIASLAGIFNPYFKLAAEDTDKVNDWVKGYAKKCWSGAELDKHHFQIFAPVHTTLNLSFSVKKLERNRDNCYAFTFPGFLSTFTGFKYAHQYLQRMSTYELPGSLLQKVQWTLEIPEDFELVLQPAPITLATPVAQFEQTCEYKQNQAKPASLSYTQTLKFNSRFVKPDHFPDFRNIILEDARPHHRMLFLALK
ncbi:DUF3857 domain-containing protein [bacterium]|nr:DUF3857 domain-containing protein [bacterium]